MGESAQGFPRGSILSSVVWRSSRNENVSPLYVKVALYEAVEVSDVSEESAEALSEPVSDVASDEFDSEFAVTSSIDVASVEESTSVGASL